ncbi:MAG: DNA polymerase domain-containing protein [Armatimonadota bacterium]
MSEWDEPAEGAAGTAAEAEAAPRPVAPRLFGHDDTEGVVAVEIVEREAMLLLARRGSDPDGPAWREERDRERRPFRPWLVTGDEAYDALRRHTPGPVEWKPLEGGGLRWLVEFPHWGAFLDLREQLRAQGLAHHAYGHPVKQFLVASGVTLFKGIDFGAIRRLQFDLETTTLRPEAPESRILLLVASDNRGGEWVFAGDESEIIRGFLQAVQACDPDVIEGHNLFGFDLPYLAARAEALGIPLPLGRDGSPLSFGRERNLPIGGITRPFRPANAWGRHFLDTLFGVQRFDVGRAELTSHGLKEAAIHYGLASEERVYLDRAVLAETWERDPDAVRRYARQDVEETRRLAELVFPTEFYQAQMVPDSYQNVATGGSGEKINSLLIREYLSRGYGIPLPQPPVACPGGHTEIRETGVLRRVVKADVESLYPSIMLRYRIRPESDTLDVFLPMLEELTHRRLEAKARAKRGGPEAAYWDGLQGSFKILINSFYGYLGAPTFHFNDYAAATQVTTTGQELVKRVAEALERSGSRVIEIDTDGVYFVPPEEVRTEAEEIEYVERIGESLPHGIRLAHDGRYAAMISLKIKNYVLVGYDGKKTPKGASLRSRADEPFGREFLSRAVDYLIAGDLEGLAADYQRLYDLISRGELPLEQLVRRERVTEKTFRSQAKRRAREVAQDASVGESLSVYERADGTLGLADDYAGDEDRWYYLDKLYKFASRLEGALGAEFNRIFPRPTKKKLQAERAGQLSLF